MKSVAGTTLRVIAILWLINGFAGIILAILGELNSSFIRGLLSILLGLALFKIGTWLKNSSNKQYETAP